jgi:hypothetical protein
MRRTGVGGHRKITEDKREEMFDFWKVNNRANMKTSRQFKVNAKTLSLMITSDGWHERADKIDANIKARIDRQIESRELKNIQVAKDCLKREVEAYMASHPTGSLQNIMILMRYIDEMEGNLPGGTQNNTIVGDTLVNVVAYINGLDTKQQEQHDSNLAAVFTHGGTVNRFSAN